VSGPRRRSGGFDKGRRPVRLADRAGFWPARMSPMRAAARVPLPNPSRLTGDLPDSGPEGCLLLRAGAHHVSGQPSTRTPSTRIPVTTFSTASRARLRHASAGPHYIQCHSGLCRNTVNCSDVPMIPTFSISQSVNLQAISGTHPILKESPGTSYSIASVELWK
jgi:hypothetical protein